MLIEIQEQDSPHGSWRGSIKAPEEQGKWWIFSAGRSESALPLSTFMSVDNEVSLFNGYCIPATLEHNIPCTLIRPVVTKYQRHYFDSSSLKVDGFFYCLLKGVAISDHSEATIRKIRFKSDTLTSWSSYSAFERKIDHVQLAKWMHHSFQVEGLGEIIIETGPASTQTPSRLEIFSQCSVTVNFDAETTIKNAIDLFLGLEMVFGFLIGFRSRYPTCDVWLEDKIDASGTFEISGQYYQDDTPPWGFNCTTTAVSCGADIDAIIRSFLAKKNSIRIGISTVQASRFFMKSMREQFMIVVPVLETHLRSRFTDLDEQNYIALQQRFFELIEASEDKELIKFSKSHVKIVDKKSPSFKALLQRSIEYLNAKGFRFDMVLAGRIANRRGKIFHAPLIVQDDDAQDFWSETQCVILMLLLLTLDDLCVPPEKLKDRGRALEGFGDFVDY